MQKEVRLSGSGGQGMLLAGIILAEAAIQAGHNAVQSQSYGPEARGGASKSEVIISEGDIDYPKVTAPDIMLALTQEAYEKYASDIKDDGVMVVDDSIVLTGNDKCKIYSIPIVETARQDLGKIIVANMVALGALVEASHVLPLSYVQDAILRRVPKGTEDLNKNALHAGVELVANR